MLPIVSIIGRPNVGKSTLFNRLTQSRSALVLDLPGTTRDRNYGFGKIGEQPYIVVDTAGISEDPIQNKIIIEQVKKAIVEAHVVLFMVDAASGLMAADLDLAEQLRKFGKKIILAINKIDGVNIDLVAPDFFRLGFNNIVEISAKANRGISKLVNTFNSIIDFTTVNSSNNIPEFNDYIKVAIVGQPNVGKSTLVNKILGEERVVVLDSPGTTRDSIYIPVQFGGSKYMLIDTAGMRRKARIKDLLEKFSVVKTLQAINDAEVVVLLIDASCGIVEQDLKLTKCVFDAGRSLVLAINKWDKLNKNERQKLQKILKQELHFINFVKIIPISALSGEGISKMFKATVGAFKSATSVISTNKLSLLLQQAVAQHQPPLSSNGRRIKLRYAHLGGHLPFKIIIHGNQVKSLPEHYRKYLSSFYQKNLNLSGILVNIEFKNTNNPYI